MAQTRRPLRKPGQRTVRLTDVRLTPEEDVRYREWFLRYQETHPDVPFSAWIRQAIDAQIEAQKQLLAGTGKRRSK